MSTRIYQSSIAGAFRPVVIRTLGTGVTLSGFCCDDPNGFLARREPSFLWWSIMSDALKQAEHYRDLEKRYLRLAAIGSSTERRNHYLRIAEHYSTLAEAEELSTPGHVNSE